MTIAHSTDDLSFMRYLLVGNGPVSESLTNERLSRADCVVQINACCHAERIPPEKTHFVFLLNADPDASPKVMAAFLERRHLLLAAAATIRARAPMS